MASYLTLSRVSENMRYGTAQRTLMDITNDVQKRELELSSGTRVHLPSDDPLAAERILNLTAALNRTDEYTRSIDVATQRLQTTDSVLGQLNDIVNRAHEIWMSQNGDSASTETRANASLEVANLVKEALALGNTKFDNRTLFGGYASDTAPFEAVGNYVLFQGTTNEWLVPVSADDNFASSINAENALGARSAEITGRANLTPALTLTTRVGDLHAGRGVRLGEVEVGDGAHTARVDVRGCSDLEDVVDRFNASGIVTASLTADRSGITLAAVAPGADLSVYEVDEGHTAADLGILESNAGATLDGAALDPILRSGTLLADLRGGQGLDPAGLAITNGEVTTTIDLAGIATVGELCARLNQSATYVHAEINAAKDGLNVVSLLNGAELTIAEAGGTTASDLGLLLAPAELPLAQLNRGFGVQDIYGPDFTIALHDGTTLTVDISSADTLADVVELINSAAGNGGKLVCDFGDGVSLHLADTTTGTGTLAVRPVNGSPAARSLGIEAETANATVDGGQLNPSGVRVDGIFNALIALEKSLAEDDRPTLNALGDWLDNAQNLILDARADAGGRINRLELATSRLEEQKISLNAAIGDERDTDLAEATIAYQKERLRLQAALQTTGMIGSVSLLDFLQ
jgi:flagellar hook-associated protein 3 FlgL